MIPPRVNVLADMVTVGDAVKVMAPVPWVRFAVPVKVKDPPMETGLEMVRVASTLMVPPFRVNVPDPVALLWLIFKVPPEIVIPDVLAATGMVRVPPLTLVAPV